jgi:hypothetical protein
MSKRLFVISLVLLVTLAGSVFAQDAAKAPRLTVVDPIKDFGTVAKGDKLDWTFTIKNTGTSDLEILAARPACGCTVADFDKVIKPGQSGKVAAHVDTTNFTGPIAKAVTLETNDPSTPSAQVTIHAVVRPYVDAHPAGFVRYNMIQGDAETQYITLYSEEKEPFEIVKIEAPQEWIKAEYKPVPKDALVPGVGRTGQNQYRLAVTVGGPDAKIGPLAEKIRVVTNSPHQPEFLVSVSGVVRPSIRVEPSGVNFGEVTATDAAATRSVILKSNNLKTPESFVVTKAESSVPGVKAQVKPTANKGEYEVTLQVGKDAKAGNIDGTVTIYTSDAVKPKVTVPMKGTIK